jgi:hypothetical protein
MQHGGKSMPITLELASGRKAGSLDDIFSWARGEANWLDPAWLDHQLRLRGALLSEASECLAQAHDVGAPKAELKKVRRRVRDALTNFLAAALARAEEQR